MGQKKSKKGKVSENKTIVRSPLILARTTTVYRFTDSYTGDGHRNLKPGDLVNHTHLCKVLSTKMKENSVEVELEIISTTWGKKY